MDFTKNWQEQLDNFESGPFKMAQMAQTKEGLRRTEIFYRIIERHVTAAISCTVDKDDLVKVVREVSRPALIYDIDQLENLYYPAFSGIMTCFPHVQESIGILEAVDFTFDDQSEKVNLWKAWDLLKVKADPIIRRFMGASLRFENDEDFLPLQAADLFAWWVRRWESEGLYDIPANVPRFPWAEKRRMAHVHIRYREHELREELQDILSDRSLFLMRQPIDVLRQIDEGRIYEQETGSRDKTHRCVILRWFLERFGRKS